MIPAIIHQIWWQGYLNLPPELKKNREILVKNHSKFKFIFWDEKLIHKLIKNEYNNFYSKFINEDISIIQKIDLAKYIILHKFGGIYIDLDMIYIKNIEPLIDFENNKITVSKINFNVNWIEFILLKIINKKFIFNNGFLISPKNKNFWLDLVSDCFESIENKSFINHITFYKIFNTTGPFILSKNIEKNIEQFIIKEHYVCEPCFPLNKCEINNESYLRHEHKLSWLVGELSDKNNFLKIIIRSLFVQYGKIREKIDLLTFLFFLYIIPLLILVLGPRKRLNI